MLAVDVRDDYEIIEGVKVMSPSPNKRHNKVIIGLITTIGNYARAKKLGFVFSDNLDVHLPDGNLFRPDFTFVTAANDKIVIDDENDTLHGVPDMVAEIFSRSTMHNDIGVKKDAYERNGVKEYWIINPWQETIDVYLLREGKYELDGHYENWSDDELIRLPEEERAAIKREIPVAFLDGFKVKIKNIFSWYFE
ncbi:MAG: Uma2 family endonuclease [Selenomonadaceae bacterium]|nr:Uma2 family endonuclease [Selenomonadaceae bacterium]